MASNKLLPAIFLVALSAMLAGPVAAQSCSSYSFSSNTAYTACADLHVLNSSLHWNYHQANHSVDLAYRHTGMTTSNWVVWSLNPGGGRMVGAQCLLARFNTSGQIIAYTAPVSSYQPQLNQSTALSFDVPAIRAEFVAGNIIIYATVQLPANRTNFTQVWQHGNVGDDGTPQMHLTTTDHMTSLGTVDFATGLTASSGAAAQTPPSAPPTTTPVAQSCNGYRFSNNALYASCNALPVLNSFLHWNYHEDNRSIDLAYRHTGMTSSNWVVWSLNPSGGRMVGAQCLVARFNTSNEIIAYTAPISSYQPQLQLPAALSFNVPVIRAEFVSGDIIIYATVQLPAGGSSFTQVWQHGNVDGNGNPQIHPTSGEHMSSFGTIDFATGVTSNTGGSGQSSRNRKRNIHGVLNVVSWGMLMPIGAMIARYLKVFKIATPAWFYLHVSCQASGYIVGVAGWGTGLKLGSDSPGIEQTKHRNIGITLFVFGTLQVFAMLLRPKPDHKYRLYWNIYHHSIGYSTIALSIVNIFEGFDILDPEKKWKRAYIGVLIALGAIALVLEAFTWFVVIKRKGDSPSPSDKRQQSAAGNRVNGSSYDA